ncbi:hypothetical protein D3C84_857030 [compost metagenome]
MVPSACMSRSTAAIGCTSVSHATSFHWWVKRGAACCSLVVSVSLRFSAWPSNWPRAVPISNCITARAPVNVRRFSSDSRGHPLPIACTCILMKTPIRAWMPSTFSPVRHRTCTCMSVVLQASCSMCSTAPGSRAGVTRNYTVNISPQRRWIPVPMDRSR